MPIKDYLTIAECEKCQHRKRWRSLIVLIISMVIPFWAASHIHYLTFVETLFAFVFLGIVAIIDMEYHAILLKEIFVGIILGLWIGIHHHGIWRTLAGGLLGFGMMFVLYYLGVWIQKLRNRQAQPGQYEEEALGFGDVNLMGVLGLFLGYPTVFGGLILGIISAGIFSLWVILKMLIQKNYRSQYAIPYGPFLILGALLLMLK
ncbi:MAG: prepilin peptidase [Anaerolineales bacterium]